MSPIGLYRVRSPQEIDEEIERLHRWLELVGQVAGEHSGPTVMLRVALDCLNWAAGVDGVAPFSAHIEVRPGNGGIQ